jgi:2-oxo-4-hydroxy-4-carboxy-5-ureidoimidazoline decarboxylase
VTIEDLNDLDRVSFARTVGPAFEAAPWVAEAAWEGRPFDDVDDLHARMCDVVDDAPDDRRLELIAGHPDLAGRAAVAGGLTPESTVEQASAGLDRLTEEELRRFTRLNGAYTARFGFPFVIAVREHTKESILAAFEERLQHTPEQERATALEQVKTIARHRLAGMVEAG